MALWPTLLAPGSCSILHMDMPITGGILLSIRVHKDGPSRVPSPLPRKKPELRTLVRWVDVGLSRAPIFSINKPSLTPHADVLSRGLFKGQTHGLGTGNTNTREMSMTAAVGVCVTGPSWPGSLSPRKTRGLEALDALEVTVGSSAFRCGQSSGNKLWVCPQDGDAARSTMAVVETADVRGRACYPGSL